MRNSLSPSRWLSTAGAVGLALVLTACGTGARASTTGSTAPSSTVAADGASGPSGASGNGGRFNLTPAQLAQLKAYSDCLTQHGVTIQRLVRLASGQGFGGRPSGSTGPRGPSGASGQGGGGFGGPNGGGTPTTIDQAAFNTADAACASQRPVGIDIATLISPRGGFGGGNRGANSAAFRAYVSCLGDHGVKVTTPTTSANTSPTTAASSASSVPAPVPTFDRNDPNFAAANQICRALLPNNGAPGGAASTTTTTQA